MRVCKERCVLVPPRRPGDSQKAPGRLVGCPRSDPNSVICWTHNLPFTSPQDPAPSARKQDMMRLHPEPSSKGRMKSQCPVNSRIALCMPFTPTELQLVDARLCMKAETRVGTWLSYNNLARAFHLGPFFSYYAKNKLWNRADNSGLRHLLKLGLQKIFVYLKN